MALLRQFYTNFTSGELSPLFSSRIDSEAYKNGGKTLTNVRLRAQGGVTRRPGLRYLQTLSNVPYQSEPYIYDEDESYLLLFHNGSLTIVDTSNPTAVLQTISGCSWVTASIGQMIVSQSGDTMIIVHPNHPIQKLTRTSASNFSLSNYAFDVSGGKMFQPYHKFAAASTTITPSGTSGSVTLTASANVFEASHNGLYLRLVDSADTVVHALISNYSNATTVTATLSGAVANTNAIDKWSEPVFSSVRGFPRTVTFHDQRLIFGGSRDLPNFLFMSKTGEFFNFDVGTGLDDESIQVQIAENQVSEIKALSSFRHLSIFTSEQELYVPTTENRPLTPATITVKSQTSFGSSGVQPKDFDGATLFLTKSKGSVREFIYSDLSQGYNSDAITLLSQHLIGTPTDMETQAESSDQIESYTYLVNSDGHMPVFMSIRKEKLNGWVQYQTNGSFKNISNVNREMYVVVERTINSSTVTSLEKLSNSFHTDMGVQLSGSSSATWQVAHLPNSAVVVKSGNYALGTFTTSANGTVTLNDPVTSVEIGLAYTPVISTLPPEFQLADGVSVGQKRRIVRVVLDLFETLDVKAKGTKILIRNVTSNFALQPDAITARKEVYLLGWGTEGSVTITQDEPLPFSLNGILLEVEV
jgi:hypothetical protein